MAVCGRPGWAGESWNRYGSVVGFQVATRDNARLQPAISVKGPVPSIPKVSIATPAA